MSISSRPIRVSLLILAYLAFISLGLPDGLLGVGWPSIQVDLKVSTESVGVLLTMNTIGYLTSSVAAGFSIARLGVGWLLAGSTALASLALTGYATSPVFVLTAGFALLLGLGSGAVDSGLNAYAANVFGPRHMNWLHAFFGLGVSVGPLIMTGVLGAGLSWRWGYGIVATAQLVLATAFVLNVRAWGSRRRDAVDHGVDNPAGAAENADAGEAAAGTVAGSAGPGGGRITVLQTLRLPAVWFGALAFTVYVSIEVATGLWAFLLLTEGRGVGATAAGLCVSGYWGSLFVGRVVQGVLVERLGPSLVLRGSLLGMAVGALLVALPGPAWVAVAGLVIIGLGAAPVFPLLTLTTADRVGREHADRTIGLQIGTAGLGASLVPTFIGFLLTRFTPEALGPALLALSLLLIALYVLSTRTPTTPQTPTPPRTTQHVTQA